jgi:hypothetical protein
MHAFVAADSPNSRLSVGEGCGRNPRFPGGSIRGEVLPLQTILAGLKSPGQETAKTGADAWAIGVQ